MRNIFETAVILLATLGWWGFVYPELCLLESNQEAEEAYESEAEYVCGEAYESEVEYVCEEAGESGENDGQKQIKDGQKQIKSSQNEKKAGAQTGNTKSDGSARQLEQTDHSRIRIKSKIAEYICQVKENTAAEKEIQNDEQKRPYWGF